MEETIKKNERIERTALVTGAGRGIGRAIAVRLAKDGFDVVINYHSNQQEAEATEALCHEANPDIKTLLVQGDVSDEADVQRMVEESTAAFPAIDVLVNNAYVGRPLGTHFYRTQVVDFEESFRVNVAPVIQITQACIAAMRRKKSGLIITVGTLAARGLPPAGYSVYVATKAYLQQLARCWQSEYSHLGILSMTVLPDFMPTPLHGEMVDHLAEKELQGKSRLLMPEEVAQCISETISDTKLFTQERIVTVN